MVEEPNQLAHDQSEMPRLASALQQQQQQQHMLKHEPSDPVWSCWRESVGDDDTDDTDVADDGYKERELLAQVALLIARMLGDNNEREHCDAYDNNNNAVQNDDDNASASQHTLRSSREALLQDKLAQTLVELATEQENLQLAASAGKALLEQLSDANDDVHELRAELRASQQQLQRAEAEKTWLLEQQQATERELTQLREATADAPYASGRSSARHSRTPSHEQLRLACDAALAGVDEQQRVECRECPQRSTQLRAAVHEINALKRRCLELERQQGKQRSRSDELWLEHESLAAAAETLEAERDAAQRDLDFATAQLEQLQHELAEAAAARDNMRVTTRRLECDNDALTHTLEDRDEQLRALQADKRAAGTAAQVLTNRVASLEIENQKLLRALSECQQLGRRRSVCSRDVQPSVPSSSQPLGHADDEPQSHGNVSLEQHVRDLEQLLDEAQREAAALKLDNRLLRRQQQQQQQQLRSAADVANTKLRRIKSMTPRSTTCADILAVDKALLLAHSRSAECLEELDAEIVSEGEDGSDRTIAPSKVSVAPSATFLQRVAKSRRRHTCVGSNSIISSSSSDDDDDNEQQQKRTRARRATSVSVIPDADALRPSPSSAGGIDKAPLYLGLSVIACAATAAAAGIYARR